MRAPRAQVHTELIDVMLTRRGQSRMRLVLGAMIVGVMHPLTGMATALAWLSAYVLFEAFELIAYRPDRARVMLRGAEWRWTTLGYLATRQMLFGAFGMMGAATQEPWGMACAIMLLCGALLNCVLTARGSRWVFAATVAPLAAYFIAVPFVAGMPFWQTMAVVTAGLMNLLTGAMVWLSASRALMAERHARHESDARRAEAESAVAAKSAFVAVVSHELRTPISAILAGAAELEKAAADPGARAKARLIGDAGAMMRSLLNDLLDRAKLDAGRLAIEMVGFDLRILMADQMRLWRAEARKQGLRFAFIGAKGTPRNVRGDPTRLRQILNNLISNALKFTKEGGVTVEVACGEAIGGGHAITIAVSDTGPGMTPEQLERLFMPFEQLDVSIARSHGGSGLGLAISRDLARLLGGELTVRSAPGQGATFTVSLTLGRGAAQAPIETQTAPNRAGLQVLVVDDHEINRRAMGMLLAPLGAEVTVASNAAEGLDRLAERAFDVVLMDCYMPGMDGKAATRVLRGSPGPNRSTPVIAVTASTSPQDVRDCHAAGMTTHIAKPIDPADLYRALEQVLAGEDAAEADVA